MMDAPTHIGEPPAVSRFFREFQIAVLFLVATYLIHFTSVPSFFLYEDDYYHVGIPATQSLTWIWEQICGVWHSWPQGRPALFAFELLIGGIMNVTGSVAAGYIPVWVILAANGYLVYRLFLLRLPQTAALVGAWFFLTSCADPTKIMLTHTPAQFAITLNLLGLILYLNQRPVWGYLIAGSSLLFYEISFAIFASAELFSCLSGRVRFKRLFAAWGAWIGIALAAFAFRFFKGESRVVEVAGSLSDLGQRIITNASQGPVYGLENSYGHALGLLVQRPQFWQISLSILVVLGLALIINARARFGAQEPNSIHKPNLLTALVVLSVLTFGPYMLQLRHTVFPGFMRPVIGFHLGLGLALGFAAALIVTRCTPLPRFAKVIYAALLVLGCASLYQNLLIQNDYARSARYQAHFWKEVRRMASDAEPGDVILVPNRQLLESEYVLSNSWCTTHTWLTLFEQTGPLKDWANVPAVRPVTVFLVQPDWEQHINLNPNGPVLQHPDYTPPGFPTGQIPLVTGHVIVLEANYSEPFQRRHEPIRAGEMVIQLKNPPQNGPGALKYTKLAKYLFDNFIN